MFPLYAEGVVRDTKETHSMSMKPKLRVAATFALILVFLMSASLLSAQDEPIWRGVTISESVLPEGDTTEVYLDFGNWTAAPVRVHNVTCTYFNYNDPATVPADNLRTVSITDGNGSAVPYTTGGWTAAAIDLNRDFAAWESVSYTITLSADRANYAYNYEAGEIYPNVAYPYLLMCAITYGEGGYTDDGVHIYVEPT